MVARRDDRVLRRAVRTLAARNTRDRGVVVRVVEEHQRLTTAEVRKLHRRGYTPGPSPAPPNRRSARPQDARGGAVTETGHRHDDPTPPPLRDHPRPDPVLPTRA